jgi:hypothetical protein
LYEPGTQQQTKQYEKYHVFYGGGEFIIIIIGRKQCHFLDISAQCALLSLDHASFLSCNFTFF